MKIMLEDNELYDAIIMEFKLSSPILEEMKNEVESLAISRNDICNLLKIPVFSTEDFDEYNKEFHRNIDINKLKIKGLERRQLDLKDKIIQCKQEIKDLKLNVNKLENEILQENGQSKKYNYDLRIFLKREKFKFIKKIFFSNYRRVFLAYPNELSIKTEIAQCNKRKEKIRQEKQYGNNSIEKYKRKVIVDKIALAKMRKLIISYEKEIDILLMRIRRIVEYKDKEKKFKLETEHYEKLRHLKKNN